MGILKSVKRRVEAIEDARSRRVGEVANCLKRFFAGKLYFESYPHPDNPSKLCNDIPAEKLISASTINIVLDSPDFGQIMTIAHDAVEKHRAAGKTLKRSGEPTEEVETAMYLALTREFKALEIPLEFQAGIILLYLWLCEGVDFS